MSDTCDGATSWPHIFIYPHHAFPVDDVRKPLFPVYFSNLVWTVAGKKNDQYRVKSGP